MKTCKSGRHQYPDEHRQCSQCKNERRKEWNDKNDRSEYQRQWYQANKPTIEERRLLKLAMSEEARQARLEANHKSYLKRRDAQLNRAKK